MIARFTRLLLGAVLLASPLLLCRPLVAGGGDMGNGTRQETGEGEVVDLGSLLGSLPDRIELDPPFEIGRHNIGYANPFGALVIGSASGNCNTMALVARMFYYEGRFTGRSTPGTPDHRRRGFDFQDIAKRVEAPDWGKGSFEVRGYDSMYDMTRSMTIGPNKTARWVEQECRHRFGLAEAGPAEAAPENADQLVDVFSLVTTLHYLGSLPNQLAYWIERKITEAVSPGASTASLNAATVEGVVRHLSEGRLPILSMFNGSSFAGHVVLGYRFERRPAASAVDVFVYDSNIQCGDCMDESIIRFHLDTGRMTFMRKDAATGAIEADPIYEGNSWYDDRASTSVQIIPGPDEVEELRPLIAETLRKTRLETGTLFAVGAFLQSLCTRSPEEAPLWTNFRDLVLDMQGVQRRLGERDPGWGRLDPNCTVAEFNDFFEANNEEAVRILFPFILPHGLTVKRLGFAFQGETGNACLADVVLVIAADSSIDEIVRTLNKSLLFAGQKPLADLLDRMGGVFAGEPFALRGQVFLEKKAIGENSFAAYAPVARLLKSHVVVGDLPVDFDGELENHRVEISEGVLQRMLAAFVDFAGLPGSRASFVVVDETLDLGILGKRTVNRDAWVELRGLDVECRPGKLALVADVGGFVAVATENRGLVIDAERVEATFGLERLDGAEANRFEVTGSLSSALQVRTGLSGLGDLLTALAGSRILRGWVEKAFPSVEAQVNAFVEEQLGKVLSFAEGSTIAVNDPVVDVATVDWKGRALVPATVTASLAPFIFDFDATVERFYGQALAVTIDDVRCTEDRLVLTFLAK